MYKNLQNLKSMEKLPQHLENKIFYYLRHPITKALIDKEFLLLKSGGYAEFPCYYSGMTVVVFSPEVVGLERITDKGLYKLRSIDDIESDDEVGVNRFGSERVLHGFDSSSMIRNFDNKRACCAMTAFKMYRFIRKNFTDILMEKNEKIIEEMLQFFHITKRYEYYVPFKQLLFYGLDNSSVFEVRIECKRLKLVSASLSEITTKHISREFYDNV